MKYLTFLKLMVDVHMQCELNGMTCNNISLEISQMMSEHEYTHTYKQFWDELLSFKSD